MWPGVLYASVVVVVIDFYFDSLKLFFPSFRNLKRRSTPLRHGSSVFLFSLFAALVSSLFNIITS